ncbi:hypothetical protein [Streptomyces sp. NPDC001744]|uniref:hypothetical protein n=1 Tax=Streptomyces sp. NPDC001744 TaxID=3364606 RepID=UPI0036C358FD
MVTGKLSETAESRFSALLVGAARLPGVRIDREAYLRAALARHCSEDELRRATEETPAAAGIPLAVLDRVANESIRYETAKVSAVSAAAGIPGFIALPATVPADLAQYVAHMLRIAQKLAYLYSWPDLFSLDDDDLDDATKGVLTLFFGVMFGTQSANAAVGKVAGMMSEHLDLAVRASWSPLVSVPEHLTVRVGHDPHGHAVAAVPVRVAGPPVVRSGRARRGTRRAGRTPVHPGTGPRSGRVSGRATTPVVRAVPAGDRRTRRRGSAVASFAATGATRS